MSARETDNIQAILSVGLLTAKTPKAWRTVQIFIGR